MAEIDPAAVGPVTQPRRDGFATAAWVFLGISVLPRGGCTYLGASTIHRVTCGDAQPPSGQRLAIVLFGVVVYLALALGAWLLLRSGRSHLYPFALLLAIVACLAPAIDFGVLAFTIGMC